MSPIFTPFIFLAVIAAAYIVAYKIKDALGGKKRNEGHE